MRSAFTSLLLTATFGLLAGSGTAVAAVSTTGSLATARTQAAGAAVGGTSTTSVIVTGGFDAANPGPALALRSTERYDVATGTWSVRAPMTTARAQHHAFYLPSLTRLRNSPGIVVIGGVDAAGAAVPQPELYDIAGDAWDPGVAVTPPRRSDAATLRTGRAGEPLVVTSGGVVAGGPAPSTTNRVDQYDVEADAWSTLTPMAVARRDHAMVTLPDGRILVAGGYNAANTPLATTEIYDPTANSWKAGPPLMTARADFTLSLVDATHVVAVGGVNASNAPLTTSEVLDPTNLSTYPTTPNAWADAGTLAVARAGHAATVVRSGWLAVTGGRGSGGAALDSAESWTPANGWGGLYATPGSSSIGGARVDHLAAAIPQSDQVLLAGGGVVAGNAPSTVVGSSVLWRPDAPIVPTTPPATTPAPTTPGPSTPDPSPTVAPTPEQGRTVVVGRASGNVFVRIGTTDEYRELTQDEGVPFGTVIDATDGHVRVTAIVDGVLQSAEFWGGTFIVKEAKDGWIEIRLYGKLKCKNGKPVSSKKAVRLVKRKSKPKAWGDGKGKFRTKGKHSSASVRGTRWLVEERCTGTFTKVSRGVVKVRDFPKHRNVTVRAGKNYLAKPKAK